MSNASKDYIERSEKKVEKAAASLGLTVYAYLRDRKGKAIGAVGKDSKGMLARFELKKE